MGLISNHSKAHAAHFCFAEAGRFCLDICAAAILGSSRAFRDALLSLKTGKAPDSIAAVEMTDFLADTASSWAANDVKP